MKRSVRLSSAVLALTCGTVSLSAAPVHLRTSYRENPLGIGSQEPSFLWQSDSTERSWKQTAYRVLIASDPAQLAKAKPDMWDSGRRTSDESVDIRYAGKPLLSAHRYFWAVQVWDKRNHMEQSAPAWFETGLLRPTDWTAKWISPNQTEQDADHVSAKWIVPTQDAADQKVVVFRKTITLTQPAYRASLSVIANGAFQTVVNGRPVSHKDGWQSFEFHEIHTDLHAGENVVEIQATLPKVDNRTQMQSARAIAALVKITDQNGSIHRFGTDASWSAVFSGNGNQAVQLAPLGSYLADSGPTAHVGTLLQKPFTLPRKVKSARLYITAMGSYRASLNGQPVGDAVLTPDFTDYRKRVTYQTYDVSPLVRSGSNAISVLLGPGWYGSGMTWAGSYTFGTAPPSLIAQLVIETEDGQRTTITTDSTWRSAESPILNSEIYAGETYDARLEPNHSDHKGLPTIVQPPPPALITAQEDLTVRRTDHVAPVKATILANGDTVFDMGQNIVGWARLKAQGERGHTIHMQFAERLNPDGSVYTANLRSAEANDTWILRGGGPETFEPAFTFHGFRYIQLSGYPGKADLAALEGIVVNSLPLQPSAKLETSSDLVNKMWNAGLWGQRGNFVSIPTDCPQRDERLGWMGDAGVFWRTGTYNFDIASFTHKFLQDVNDAQTSDGAFTDVSPNVLTGTEALGAPGWGDAGIILPYTAWLQYADRGAIGKSWPAMERWMDFIERSNPDHLRRNELGPNYGDWLAPDEKSPKDLIATAYWAMLADMMQKMAHATGRSEAEAKYEALHAAIRDAYQQAYLTPDGDVQGKTQTAYLLTLYMHLAPLDREKEIADRLVADIDAHKQHLTTGFLGTPFLLSALDEQGRLETAYKLLLNDTYPSWGYMIAKGATTWWERWNGDTGDPAMNSYNHYAFGSVMAWVYRRVAGIDTSPDGPGFQRIVIAPQRSPLMSSASTEYESVHGRIATSWKDDGKTFTLNVTVPANSSAIVTVPGSPASQLYQDGKALPASAQTNAHHVQVGSGSYQFESREP